MALFPSGQIRLSLNQAIAEGKNPSFFATGLGWIFHGAPKLGYCLATIILLPSSLSFRIFLLSAPRRIGASGLRLHVVTSAA